MMPRSLQCLLRLPNALLTQLDLQSTPAVKNRHGTCNSQDRCVKLVCTSLNRSSKVWATTEGFSARMSNQQADALRGAPASDCL